MEEENSSSIIHVKPTNEIIPTFPLQIPSLQQKASLGSELNKAISCTLGVDY